MSSLISGRVARIVKDCQEAIRKGDKGIEDLVKQLNMSWNDMASVLIVEEYLPPLSTEVIEKGFQVSERGIILMESGNMYWSWKGGSRSIKKDPADSDLGFILADTNTEFYRY